LLGSNGATTVTPSKAFLPPNTYEASACQALWFRVALEAPLTTLLLEMTYSPSTAQAAVIE
jgi:hypothetical protein